MYTYTKVWTKYILTVVALHAVVAYSRRKMWKGLQEDNLPSADQVWLKEKQNQNKTYKLKKENAQTQPPQLKQVSSQNPHMLHILYQKTH